MSSCVSFRYDIIHLMPFHATSASLIGLQVRRSKLGNIRLVCDGDKNKVQASTVDRDKNNEQASNRFGWYLEQL